MWTRAQTAEFLDGIAGEPLFAVFHLIAMRGLRRGEASGLRWDDLDLDEGLAYVERQIQPDAGGRLRGIPAEDRVQRPRGQPGPETLAVLRSHRQSKQFRASGITPHGWVFAAGDGGPLSPDYLTGAFSRLVDDSGLPPVRLHDLRHGAATLMLLAGDELKIIADQLGHSSVVLTADTYLSVAAELGLKSAADAARLVLTAGRHPPGGDVRRRSAPVLAMITA